jgi:hypothetical protein
MQSSYISIFKTYLQAGKLLHIITLIEITALLFILPFLFMLEAGNSLLFLIQLWAILFFSSLPVFSQLDARSRFQNYKQIKDQIFIYGFDKRILNPVLKSRCQRDAALLSATELGYRDQCEAYFKSHGYKAYHILPDFIFTHPELLFSKYFWITTFFASSYTSKIDYASMKKGIIETNSLIPQIDAQ